MNQQVAAAPPAETELELRCIECERPLARYRAEADGGILLRCPSCGALQHRRLGAGAPWAA